MIIIERYTQAQTGIVGRLSDGSDRQKVISSIFLVKVEDNDRFYLLTFDHEPTDAEIIIAFEEGQGEEVTTIEDLAGKISEAKQRLTATEDVILILMGI